MPQGIPDHLGQAYRRAVYRARDAHGTWHAFSLDAGAPGDDAGRLPFRPPWVIVTACNPRSVARTDGENTAAMSRLATALRELGVLVRDAVSHDPNDPWHWREASYLAEGLSMDSALCVVRVFRQHACVYAEGGRVGLLMADAGRWEPRGLRVHQAESA